ncbi:K(+)-transporting ATPase subunit F [Knoellia koreensis]|uniref:K(+)-transporting ATPase subunit F n=1 Tax=Knoellia koreensis TaxID=2730921 RepID=A0A849HCP0_9MICO|nr:K(+)-transporting ATPase subunit F [Knoellia sp. DB2414S]NNM44413.1 K(+)-transporting ATPase subunit F [Knoellia sp. DB2414S]
MVLQVNDFDVIHTPRAPLERSRRQGRVKGRQGGVNAAYRRLVSSLTGDVIENLVAALLGVALLGYLVYALLRPEKF